MVIARKIGVSILLVSRIFKLRILLPFAYPCYVFHCGRWTRPYQTHYTVNRTDGVGSFRVTLFQSYLKLPWLDVIAAD